MIAEVVPVEIDVPRDRDGSFEPKIVRKRQRRLGGVDEMVISLTAKGLATGEVQAHIAEVYGSDTSRRRSRRSLTGFSARGPSGRTGPSTTASRCTGPFERRSGVACPCSWPALVSG